MKSKAGFRCSGLLLNEFGRLDRNSLTNSAKQASAESASGQATPLESPQPV